MTSVRPKKRLGQHFLNDRNLARKIVGSLTGHGGYKTVLEIGPGMGILSEHLFNLPELNVKLIEIDSESVEYLSHRFPDQKQQILEADFLSLQLDRDYGSKLAIIGNFPYNISSQILFKVLENRTKVQEVVGMLQKEVADRICSEPGSKKYGILSVLLQAFYDLDKITDVNPSAFNPPPKVISSVIRLKRNKVDRLACDEKLFFKVVKQGFQNRRKTLRNALKSINLPQYFQREGILSLRAEQLSVQDFVQLTNKLDL